MEVDIMYCGKCGNQVNDGDLFCPKCGFKLNQSEDSVSYNLLLSNKRVNRLVKNKKNVIIGFCVLFLIGIILIISSQSKVNVIGEWSTDRGMDSSILDFKSNGELIFQSDILTVKSYTYSISSNKDLCLSNKYNNNSFVYTFSSSAMNGDGDSWYIEDDVLYIWGISFYKQ